MRTTIVIGIVLMSLACIVPTAAADGESTGDPARTAAGQTGCPVVDPTSVPPVRMEPCNDG